MSRPYKMKPISKDSNITELVSQSNKDEVVKLVAEIFSDAGVPIPAILAYLESLGFVGTLVKIPPRVNIEVQGEGIRVLLASVDDKGGE